MKALFITPSLGAGGAERQWSILLPGLRERGHDARLLALDSPGPFLEPMLRAGVPVEVLAMRHQLDLRSLWRSEQIRSFSPDIVITRGVSGLYVGHALAHWHRAVHVFNEHRQVGLPLSRRREAMTRLVARRLGLVITVTPEQAEPWLSRGVDAGRIVTIDNGVPVPVVTETRESIRAELGLGGDAVVAVLVASMRPVKRIPDFVAAVRQARGVHPELTGVVVGDGPDLAAVRAAAGGDAGIRLLGHRDDVARILAAGDVFVLASEHEAAPMAILEAMAAGLPVVCPAVGGIGELVEHRVSGLLVAPRAPEQLAAGLVELTGDRDLRRAMGAAGAQRHRRRWTADAMIGRYETVLCGMTGPRAVRRTTGRRRRRA